MRVSDSAARYVAKQVGTTSRVGNELLIYDASTGDVHVLNSTARAIWEACAEPQTQEQLAARLHAQFAGADPAQVRRDVETVLTEFCVKHLLACVQEATGDAQRAVPDRLEKGESHART